MKGEVVGGGGEGGHCQPEALLGLFAVIGSIVLMQQLTCVPAVSV